MKNKNEGMNLIKIDADVTSHFVINEELQWPQMQG